MLICVKGEKTQPQAPPPDPPQKRKHTETEGKTGKKYVVAVRGGGEKKQRTSQITPSSLPPSSLVETSRESALAPRPDYD